MQGINKLRQPLHWLNMTSVACAIGPSVNPLQNRATQHVNIVFQCMYQFFEQPNMKGNHAWIELNGKPSTVTTFSTDFSFQNLIFFEIFSSRNHVQIHISHILNPNITKQPPLNPAHQDLSHNTKGTFQFFQNFQLRFNLIFSEEIIQYSRTSTPQVQMPWNQAYAPLLLKSFPKLSKETKNAIWSILVRWISSIQNKTKQNKQTTLLQ